MMQCGINGIIYIIYERLNVMNNPIEITNNSSKELIKGFAELKEFEKDVNAIEKQTINILGRLTDSNKSFVLDFVKFIEQKQLKAMHEEEIAKKKSRNSAYLDKIQRGITQCTEGRGLVREIVEVQEDE